MLGFSCLSIAACHRRRRRGRRTLVRAAIQPEGRAGVCAQTCALSGTLRRPLWISERQTQQQKRSTVSLPSAGRPPGPGLPRRRHGGCGEKQQVILSSPGFCLNPKGLGSHDMTFSGRVSSAPVTRGGGARAANAILATFEELCDVMWTLPRQLCKRSNSNLPFEFEHSGPSGARKRSAIVEEEPNGPLKPLKPVLSIFTTGDRHC